jgi:hypothetical protein
MGGAGVLVATLKVRWLSISNFYGFLRLPFILTSLSTIHHTVAPNSGYASWHLQSQLGRRKSMLQ